MSVAMPGRAPNGRKRALEPAVNEGLVRCGADRNPTREKMRRAVVPAIADVVRFLCFFRGEERQNIEKQRIIEEKVPRNK